MVHDTSAKTHSGHQKVVLALIFKTPKKVFRGNKAASTLQRFWTFSTCVEYFMHVKLCRDTRLKRRLVRLLTLSQSCATAALQTAEPDRTGSETGEEKFRIRCEPYQTQKDKRLLTV